MWFIKLVNEEGNNYLLYSDGFIGYPTEQGAHQYLVNNLLLSIQMQAKPIFIKDLGLLISVPFSILDCFIGYYIEMVRIP